MALSISTSELSVYFSDPVTYLHAATLEMRPIVSNLDFYNPYLKSTAINPHIE